MRKQKSITVLFTVMLPLWASGGCNKESETNICEQAAEYVTGCTGKYVEAPAECGSQERLEAQQYLSLDCADIKPGGKADWIGNCSWIGKMLGWCREYICEDFRSPIDHDALVGKLLALDSKDMQNLFYCDLTEMGGRVPAGEYLELMQTSPYAFDWSSYNDSGILRVTAQFWDVYWAYGFDAHALYDEVKVLLPETLQDLFAQILEPLTFIKKEFPAQDAVVLEGWTSFGYNDERANENPTRDFIYRKNLSDANIENLPILLMTYSQSPWYLEETGTGFIDYFRFLTRDIIIAKGNYGPYAPHNPELSPYEYLSPEALQFWMERKTETREIDLNEETTYISIPMIQSLWAGSPEGFPGEEILTGIWEGDLIMNSVIWRDEAQMVIEEGGASGSFTTVMDEADGEFEFHHLEEFGDGRTVIVPLDTYPMNIRRVSLEADVMVGKRCIPVRDEEEAKSLGVYVDFLPDTIRQYFIAQYIEGRAGDTSYCLYYLFRKAS